jgi:hypothetical protein
MRTIATRAEPWTTMGHWIAWAESIVRVLLPYSHGSRAAFAIVTADAPGGNLPMMPPAIIPSLAFLSAFWRRRGQSR